MAKEATNNHTEIDTENSESKIDAIKRLIFGDNMDEYSHEFDNVKQDVLEKKKELESLMEDVKTELLQNLDNISTDVNIRITELENTLNQKTNAIDENKLDRKLFGDLLIKLGEKISV